jgi:hypothetical protein
MSVISLSPEKSRTLSQSLLDGRASVLMLPTQDDQVELSINNTVVGIYPLYGDACDAVHQLINL